MGLFVVLIIHLTKKSQVDHLEKIWENNEKWENGDYGQYGSNMLIMQ